MFLYIYRECDRLKFKVLTFLKTSGATLRIFTCACEALPEGAPPRNAHQERERPKGYAERYALALASGRAPRDGFQSRHGL